MFEASFADAGVPAVAGAPARQQRRRRLPPARWPASSTRARSINLYMLDLVTVLDSRVAYKRAANAPHSGGPAGRRVQDAAGTKTDDEHGVY